MLLLVEVDLISRKKSCKQNLVWPNGSGDSKIVLTWLAKIVIFHVRLIAIDVQSFDLKFISR